MAAFRQALLVPWGTAKMFLQNGDDDGQRNNEKDTSLYHTRRDTNHLFTMFTIINQTYTSLDRRVSQ